MANLWAGPDPPEQDTQSKPQVMSKDWEARNKMRQQYLTQNGQPGQAGQVDQFGTPMGRRNPWTQKYGDNTSFSTWLSGMMGPQGGGGQQNTRPNPWMQNPWGGYSMDNSQWMPAWAKPKPVTPTPEPAKPVDNFKQIAGFQDYGDEMSGSLDQARGLLAAEAKARGINPDQNQWNAAMAGSGYTGGNVNGSQFNKARRLLFGGMGG